MKESLLAMLSVGEFREAAVEAFAGALERRELLGLAGRMGDGVGEGSRATCAGSSHDVGCASEEASEPRRISYSEAIAIARSKEEMKPEMEPEVRVMGSRAAAGEQGGKREGRASPGRVAERPDAVALAPSDRFSGQLDRLYCCV